jgi:hypothetical protein
MDNLSDSAMKIGHQEPKTLEICFQSATAEEVTQLHQTLTTMLEQYNRAQAPIGWHMPAQMAEEVRKVHCVKMYNSVTKEDRVELLIEDVEIDSATTKT